MAERTPTRPIRVPIRLWDAYGRVLARRGRERTQDLLDHMRREIEQHGDADDRADLAAAEAELVERRARKGGRPRKSPQIEARPTTTQR